jgi:hypothetical protein
MLIKTKITFFIIFLLLLVSSSYSIETVDIQDSINSYNLENYLSFYKDSSEKMSIESIINGISHKTITLKKGRVQGFSKGSEAYWFFIRLRQKTKSEKKWFLKINWRILDTIDCYYIDEGNTAKGFKVIQNFKSGTTVSIKQRSVKHRYYMFPFEFQKNKDALVVIRATACLNVAMPLVLIEEETHSYQDKIELLVQGTFFGILLIMIFYNLFIYLSIRDKSYLIYVFYVISNLAYQLASIGIGYQYLWPDSVWFETRSTLILGNWTFFVAGLFVIDYLKLKKNSEIFFRISLILAALWFMVFLTSFAEDPSFSTLFSTPLVLFSCVFTMFLGINLWIRGFAEARFFTYRMGNHDWRHCCIHIIS